MVEVIFNNEQLQEKLKEWQKQLRLQDWIITAGIKRKRDLLDGSQASVSWVLSKKMAIIGILDPIDYPPDSMVPQDMEVSLVHELLHLHFAPISDTDDENKFQIAEEQAIESISYGIVEAIRSAFNQL